MKRNKLFIISLLALTLCSCNSADESNSTSTNNNTNIEITDLIGRKNTINPGSYKQVVCIGAGALRLYSYVGDVSFLSGVEDIDNTSLTNRPKCLMELLVLMLLLMETHLVNYHHVV